MPDRWERLRILLCQFRDGFSNDTSSTGDHTAAMNSRAWSACVDLRQSRHEGREFSLVALKKVSAFAPSWLDLNQGSRFCSNYTVISRV
jgi:hypothetical protein